jgi:hypothetical protein
MVSGDDSVPAPREAPVIAEAPPKGDTAVVSLDAFRKK